MKLTIFYECHRDIGCTTENCYQLKKHIENFIKKGYLKNTIKKTYDDILIINKVVIPNP